MTRGISAVEQPHARGVSARGRRLPAAVAALGCFAAYAFATATPAHADDIRDKEWPLAFLNASAANRISSGSGVTLALLDS